MTIRKLPETTPRVETGPTQFGDDWPGVFIRGDNSAYFAIILHEFLENNKKSIDPIKYFALVGLYDSLRSAVVGPSATMFPQIDPITRK